MKTLLTAVQGFGIGVFMGVIVALEYGGEVGKAVAMTGFVLSLGAIITSKQGGDIR